MEEVEVALLRARLQAHALRTRELIRELARLQEAGRTLLSAIEPELLERIQDEEVAEAMAALAEAFGEMMAAGEMQVEVQARQAEEGKAPEAAAESAPAEPAEVGERAVELLRLLGETGEFFSGRLKERWQGGSEAMFRKNLAELEDAGWVETREVKVPAPPRFRDRLWGTAVRLTEKGQEEFRRRFGAEPRSDYERFVGKYKTVEAGLTIRLTREVIESLNGLPEGDRAWSYEVVDTVWSSDEELDKVPWAKRAYSSPDGEYTAFPDLVVKMSPIGGGVPVVALVEVELAGYKKQELREKWRRCIRCYPPHLIVIVGPNKSIRGMLFQEFMEVLDEEREKGLPEGVKVMAYSLDELAEIGLLSMKQVVRLEHRRKKGEKDIKLPKYYNQPRTTGGKEAKQGELGVR